MFAARTALLASISAALVSSASAQLVYEPFGAYSSGSLAGQTVAGSGLAPSSNWITLAGTVNVTTSGGLSFSSGGQSLVTSGGLAFTPAAGANGVLANVDVSPAGPFGSLGLVQSSLVGAGNVSGTIYLSFLGRNASTDVPDGNSDFAGFQLFQGAAEGLGIGNNWGAWAYSTFGVGGDGDLVRPSDSSFLLMNSSVHLFVAKIQFNAASDDNITVWMDPDLSQPEASQPNTVYRRAGSGNAAFDRIAVRSGSDNNNNSWEYDEVRIGTTWSQVTPVPEPTAALSLALGGLLLAGRRTRRS
jgi:hypothetical protein